MATPTSADISADSGYPVAEDNSPRLPSQGSGSGAAQNQNEASPTLRTPEVFTTATNPLHQAHNPSIDGRCPAETLPSGEMVNAELERDPTGTSMMVGCKQSHSLRDKEIALAEKESVIEHLRQQVCAISIESDFKEQEFLVDKEELDSQIAAKNDEIKRLKDRMESCRVHISKLEKTNHEDKVKYESQIQHLEEELNRKVEEIGYMSKIFWKKLEISRMECDLERDKRAVAECKAAQMKEEVDKKEAPVSVEDRMIERMDVRSY